MEAIFLLRHLMKKYRVVCKDLHIVFIDIETVYDKVLKEVIKDMCEKRNDFFF